MASKARDPREQRFGDYVQRLALALGHRDRLQADDMHQGDDLIAIKVGIGRSKEVGVVTYVLAVLFLLHFLFGR